MSLHLADVLQQFLPSYQQSNKLNMQQQKACQHILQCRTAALGQQLWECQQCHQQQLVYCSCRDRNCPRCQGQRTQQWIETQAEHLVQARYFHLVFTLPHELNVISHFAEEVLYQCLFKAVWQTLSTFAQRHRKHAGQLGMTAVLHTWGQTLSQHIHLHCLIPGGMLSKTGRWQVIDKEYLFPVKALSTVFRAKMLAALRDEKIQIASSEALMSKPWSVFSKACLCKPETVLRYLGRYTRKGMLHESRLVQMNEHSVSFRYKDYQDGNQKKVMTVSGEEFIRRYLSHVLPKGLMRIRHFGWLSNKSRKEKLALIKAQEPKAATLRKKPDATTEPIWHCPHCKGGVLQLAGLLKRLDTGPPDN